VDKEEIMSKLKGYLDDNNYIAAVLLLKNEDIPDDTRYEITGEVAAQIIDDIGSEKNRERVLYLRSILAWLFKDVPGLASVYREQLRNATGNQVLMREFIRGIRNFADVTTDGVSEEVADNLRPDAIQEKVKDFFSQAGVDIDDGIKKAQDFFDNLSGRRRGTDDTPDETGSADDE